MTFPLSLTGSDFQIPEVQHGIGYKDRSGAGQPIRAAQDVRRTEEGQQELPVAHHKGMSQHTVPPRTLRPSANSNNIMKYGPQIKYLLLYFLHIYVKKYNTVFMC